MSVRRNILVLLIGAMALLAPTAAPFAAHAEDAPPPTRVTVMGSLMSELGCAGDWDTACATTDMTAGAGGVWTYTATLPAGQYEWKVRLNGSWDVSYGAGGALGGANIPLALQNAASLRFTYDQATHALDVVTTTPAPDVPTAGDRANAGTGLRENLTKERFYFVMADRFDNGNQANDNGGYTPTKDVSGFDPTDEAFYHGGDLQGIINRLDYISGLGTTAIWMTPSFKNKPVQDVGGGAKAGGYHGYWITDFTQIDPHLGTNAQLGELITKAHARGIKIFFDIITNHTADVQGYDDSAYSGGAAVPYKSKAEAPYKDVNGNAFDDRAFTMGSTFPAVDASSFPYAPVVPAGSEHAKVPAWLNDPTMYHNRGTSTFAGEDSEYGDFPAGQRAALDDLWTERPQVVNGMIDIYQKWVKDYGVDGFRIDTVKHVDMDFWKRFSPALTGYAAQQGNAKFFMFGEVYDADPRFMSRYTTTGRLQATVDFGFQGTGVNFAKGRPTSEVRDFYASDDYYTDADSNAYSQPTFLGNHDMGRFGFFLKDVPAAEKLQRDELGHALMYLTRGQPVVYYGDEQGFAGDGGDQDARQDMMASKVASYNDDQLIGTTATTAQANFDPTHPLYRDLAALAALRTAHPALADGAQIHRYSSKDAGVYAFSRIDPAQQIEYVVALNNATTAKTVTLQTFNRKVMYRQLWPAAQSRVLSDGEGRITVTVPPLSAVVWRANDALAADPAPTAFFTSPSPAGVVGGRAEIGVTVPGNGFRQVTFEYRPVGSSAWTVLGTDDNAPYRVFQDVSGLPTGTYLEYRAVVRDHDGDLAVANRHGFVGTPPPAVTGAGTGSVSPVPQPAAVSVPGSHGSEMGCTPVLATAGGDWEPGCDAAQLALRTDGLWSGTYALPAATYEYKAALDRGWDVNYGKGGVQNGSNIPYTHAGGAISFFYDQRTHYVQNTSQAPIWSATGSFQSELGCPGDWDPGCRNAFLQDADGDGVFVHRTDQIPPGTYEGKATQNGAWDGAIPAANVPFTVAKAGDIVRFTLDPSTGSLGVTTEAPPVVPDLSTARASWTAPDAIAYAPPPGDRRGWTYRLHYGPAGSLAIETETIGGSSVPLTATGNGMFALSKADARNAWTIARSGQLGVAAYDVLGRVVDATGVTVGAWVTRSP